MLPCCSTRTRSAIVGDDAEVVRDQQQREAEDSSQVVDQLEDGGLDGDVERRVISSQISTSGVGRERASDRRRAGARRRRAPPGSGRRSAAGRRTRLSRRSTSASASLRDEAAQHLGRARDALRDRVPRVERVARVLEDDLDPLALLARDAGGPGRRAPHRPRTICAAGETVQPGDRPRDRRLAAARLADQRDALAAPER